MFDFARLSFDDRQIFLNFVGELRDPDLIIAPEGYPYIYRWHVTPAKGPANIYLHIQVADDPERPLHNHPWDNTSVILSGGYKERLCMSEGQPHDDLTFTLLRYKGDTVFRKAGWSHRIELLYGLKYTMTLFTTGPKVQEWGFWYPDGFKLWTDVTRTEDGISIHIEEGM